jgi:hypothetical protein
MKIWIPILGILSVALSLMDLAVPGSPVSTWLSRALGASSISFAVWVLALLAR